MQAAIPSRRPFLLGALSIALMYSSLLPASADHGGFGGGPPGGVPAGGFHNGGFNPGGGPPASFGIPFFAGNGGGGNGGGGNPNPGGGAPVNLGVGTLNITPGGGPQGFAPVGGGGVGGGPQGFAPLAIGGGGSGNAGGVGGLSINPQAFGAVVPFAAPAGVTQPGTSVLPISPANAFIPAAVSSDHDLGIPSALNDAANIAIDTNQKISLSEIYVQGITDNIPAEAKSSTKMAFKQGGKDVLAGITPGANVLKGEVVEEGTKTVVLNKGNVLFTTDSPTIVQNNFGKVYIDSKSVVLVMASVNGLSVYNLDDAHSHAVKIKVGKETIHLGPGDQSMITNATVQTFEEVNPAGIMGYRQVFSKPLGSGLKAFISEFSIPSAIYGVPALRDLLASQKSEAKRIAEHLIKTTAIVLRMKGTTAPYQQLVMRPGLTSSYKPN